MTKTKYKVTENSEINISAAKALKTKFSFKNWKDRFQCKYKDKAGKVNYCEIENFQYI